MSNEFFYLDSCVSYFGNFSCELNSHLVLKRTLPQKLVNVDIEVKSVICLIALKDGILFLQELLHGFLRAINFIASMNKCLKLQ